MWAQLDNWRSGRDGINYPLTNEAFLLHADVILRLQLYGCGMWSIEPMILYHS